MIALSQNIPAKEFEKQYKEHLSGFRQWKEKNHAEDWLIFPKNISKHLSVDEIDLSNGELYTVITNKAAHGKRGALVAMVQGTKTQEIARVLAKIPDFQRDIVTEVTLDMSESLESAIRHSFPRARIVTDRFHSQQLVSEAVQEMRIVLRKEAIEEENQAIKDSRKQDKSYLPVIYENGDTKKQLLARSRYLLFKPQSKWNSQQEERATILFREFPKLKAAYDLSMMFRSCYEHSQTISEAKERIQQWYQKIEEKGMDSFMIAAESIRLHEATILNYFINRSTNASAESFNAKLKSFRAVVRGVRDKTFHLFRIAKIYG